MKHKDFAVDIKSADLEDGGRILAYASTFDRVPDKAGDVVARGAFTDSLAKWASSGNSIPVLYGHRTDDPKMNIGKVKSAREDERGLLVELELDADNPTAQYCRKLVKEGRLSKLSFAYTTKDSGFVKLATGKSANELRKLDIHEVSLVPIPANDNAVILEAKDGEEGTDDKGGAEGPGEPISLEPHENEVVEEEPVTEPVEEETEEEAEEEASEETEKEIEEEPEEVEAETETETEPSETVKAIAAALADAFAPLNTTLSNMSTVLERLSNALPDSTPQTDETVEIPTEDAAQASDEEAPVDSEDTQTTDEGDSSETAAAAEGEKGAQTVDPEFLARFYKAIKKED